VAAVAIPIEDGDEDEYQSSGPPNHDLKAPCGNCPFRKKGAIELQPGRLPGIIETLERDTNFFQCHKTTHGAKPQESMCMGSVAWMLKNRGRISIMTRLALMDKSLTIKDIEKVYPTLIEEKDIV
jgi:hypothetical protein